MSTRDGLEILRAADVVIGEVYRTRIESGSVSARVVRQLPATEKSRNVLFECVNVATGETLPKLKRAEDLSR